MEGLGVFDFTAAQGRIADVTDPQVAAQPAHVALVEYLQYETAPLLDVEGVGERDDPGRVLAAMLDAQQAFVDLVGDVDAVGTVDADESTHGFWLAVMERAAPHEG